MRVIEKLGEVTQMRELRFFRMISVHHAVHGPFFNGGIYSCYTRVTLYPLPPRVPGPPPMDLGRFEISKGPSNRGGLDLGLFEKSNRPSRRGGLDCGLFRRSNRPSKRVETPQKSLSLGVGT